jgi:3'(2'), 5'-bisphosphate nucleotidase
MTAAEINTIITILREAAAQILEVYHSPDFLSTVEWKSDESPLTIADRRSHAHIERELHSRFPSIPIMSEEAHIPPYEERSQWSRYWCLDPLDGTKEFMKRNDQYTINLALIENRRPVLGFIHVPVLALTYWAELGEGAFVVEEGVTRPIAANKKTAGWIALASNSHGSSTEIEFLRKYPIGETIRVGSALKFCMIACGKADVYYRQGRTMEWDTAAGQILVEESGAHFEYLGKEGAHYNKYELNNPSFLVKIA